MFTSQKIKTIKATAKNKNNPVKNRICFWC
jgi:hypothetical protein